MNSVAFKPVTWSLRRWLFLLALVFISQLALIYLLSARGHAPIRLQPSRASIQLFNRRVSESQFSERFLASDPTLFAIANRHGFSGAAWLKVPERNYDLTQRASEAPFWLALNSEQLGKGIGQFVSTNAIAPLLNVETIEPKILARLIPGFETPAKSNSLLRIEGDLAGRETMSWPELKPIPHTNLLSNSIVQVAVDRNGLVLSSRLLSRSGSAETDRDALEIARNFSFVPENGDQIVSGKLIFDWHTVPLVAINSTNIALPAK